MTITTPRVRPRFAKASAVVFLLLVPFVVHAVWDYVEARRLRVRIEAIAARGEPLTVRETEGARPTGGAAEAERYYRAAAALLSDVYEGVPSTTGYRIRTAEGDKVWPPELVTVIRGAVERNVEPLGLVDRAAALPFERFAPGTVHDYLMGELSTLARLCDWRATLRALDGDSEGAAASLYSEARLARAMRWPPQFGAVPLVFERGRPSAAARGRLDEALATLDRDDGLTREFLSNRALMIDEQQMSDRRAARIAWRSPMQTWRTHLLVQALDDYQDALRAAARRWPEPLQALSPAGQRTNQPPRPSDRAHLAETIRFWARLSQMVRCVRLRVDGTLKLVDPHTGRLLELVNCKL
jgi:hypothetical protein